MSFRSLLLSPALALLLAPGLFAQAPAAAPVAQIAKPTLQRDPANVIVATCATPGTTIRYTLDGADPGPKSGPYLAPLDLPAGGVVKARAFTADRQVKSEAAELRVDPVAGAQPRPATLIPCTQDRDWPIYDWAVRHAAVSRQVRATKPTLVFIGDSITQMFGGEPHDRGQPGKEVWERHFGARHAANLGFGYDFIENTLWRIQHGELDGAAAQAVVILIGTNNAGKNTPVEMADGVRALCEEIQRRQPKAHLILMAIFPRGPKPDAFRAKLEETNRLLAKLATDHLTFLDIGARFLEPDGTISRETMGDFLHPTAKGYEIWAEALEPELRKHL